MALKKGFWSKIKFSKYDLLVLNCPTCKIGTLKVNWNTLRTEDTAYTKLLKKSDFSSLEWDFDFQFSIFFRCSNSRCKEAISCLGTGYFDMHEEVQRNQYFPAFYEYYVPEYFSIPINIIEPKSVFPKKINKSLLDSFKLFFCDSDACGNKLRTVIEVLLDSLKIKKTFVNSKHKRIRLSLHSRILEYRKKNQQLADLLLAIKWIGNSGSHDSKITRDDTLQAYQMLDYVLAKLFENDEKDLIKIAAKINKIKKAPSFSKRRK